MKRVEEQQEESCPFQENSLSTGLQGTSSIQRFVTGTGKTAWLTMDFPTFCSVSTEQKLSADHFHPNYPAVFAVRRKVDKKGEPIVRTYSGMDPPEHGKHRRIVIKEFSLRRCENYREAIHQFAKQNLDNLFLGVKEPDLVKGFSEPFAADVISKLLGVPVSFQSDCILASRQLTSNGENQPEVERASRWFRSLLKDLITQKEMNPGNDLTSRLIMNYKDLGNYKQAQIVEFIGAIFLAGLQSSSSMISLGALTLMKDRKLVKILLDQDAKARADLVGELLRFHSIADKVTARTAKENLVIAGQQVAQDDGIIASTNAANHDPLVFPKPNTLDPKRPHNKHVAFGFGRHRCLGENLAKLEIEIALSELFKRFPDICPRKGYETVQIDRSGVFARLSNKLLVSETV